MGNLENAKDLGQSIYTKAEVNVDFAHKVSSIAGLASFGSSTPTVIVTDFKKFNKFTIMCKFIMGKIIKLIKGV